MKVIKSTFLSLGIVLASVCAHQEMFAQSDFGKKAKSLYQSHLTYVENYDYEKGSETIQEFSKEFRLLAKNDPDVALMLADKFSDEYDGNFYVKWSPDKQLVAINWDENTGGTMRTFDGIFMYRVNGEWKYVNIEDRDDAECCMGDLVYGIHQVTTKDDIEVYVIFQLFIGSSAITNHTVKTMIIEDDKLIRDAKFIKTQSGIRNDISYSNDFSEKGNLNSNLSHEDAEMKFDKKTQTILLPVIHGDGKLTKNKIKYKFNGNYFSKI